MRLSGMVGRVAVLLLVPVAAGCGPGQGRVSGRVLLDGKPLPGGFVKFLLADGRSSVVSAEIDESGNYTPVTLPAGEVIVSVDNRQFAPLPPRGPSPVPPGLSAEAASRMVGGSAAPARDGAAEARAARYLAIPARYYSAETSDLKLTIQPGNHEQDVFLTK
jgi:hypothetical protein